MKKEQEIQQAFIHSITTPKTSADENPQIDVYRELVYYRFLEVFEKAYPRFVKMLSKEQLTSLIYDFLEVGAKTPILWQVSGEFQKFVVQNNTLEMPFLADLLEFEFLEVEMYMGKYTTFDQNSFSLNNHYKLSQEVEIRHFNYPIHNPNFDANPSSFEKGDFRVLFYYDETQEKILCEEITPFLEEFILSLSLDTSLINSVSKVAKEYEIETQELLEILAPVLEHFCEKNILINSQ